MRSDVVALYVDPRGPYPKLVREWYDAERDARTYSGPAPVVAHPPCSRWCRLAGLVEARWGHKRGDDGGCFASALSIVRTFGGVLEHPAYSLAWTAFQLPRPSAGHWVRDMFDGGWTTEVEQHAYGHPAIKRTWLYAYGIASPPPLRWTRTVDTDSIAVVSWCGNRTKRGGEHRPRVGKATASRTPIEFATALLDLASAANRSTAA